jgi:hypothetical protein
MIGGVAIGAIVFSVAFGLILGLAVPKPKGHEILWRTDTGVTCRIDELYPAVDCSALLRDLGPRLSRAKVIR